LDKAVFDAYGWESTLSDEEILQRLVDLNAERAAEEAKGHVRWLRPKYQAPDEVQPQQAALVDVETTQEAQPINIEKHDWPKALKDRATAVRTVLNEFAAPVEVNELALGFNGRRTKKRLKDIGEILEMLVALGQVRKENEQFMIG
jgi:hypothetical protein